MSSVLKQNVSNCCYVPTRGILVGAGYVPVDTCEKLLAAFKPSDQWHQSTVSGGSNELAQKARVNSSSFCVAQGVPEDVLLEDMFWTFAQDQYVPLYPHFWCNKDFGYIITRYTEGGKYIEHTDGGGKLAKRVATAILYLNDDFTGGELHFPEQDYTYTPKQGDVVMLPSNYLFPHASLEMKSGVKYIANCFFESAF